MQRRELNFRRTRGFLLIVAILIMVVIAVAIAALGNMTSADIRASSGHAQSGQAYFAATSGIEYAVNRYYNGADCTAINTSGVTVGNASFSLTPTLYVPTNAPTNAFTATSSALTSTSAAVAVASTTGYAPNGRILIDTELIDYTSKTATSFNGISRGAGGTAASAHASNATVSQNVCAIASAGSVSGAAVRNLGAVVGTGTTAIAGALGTMGPDAMVAYAKGTALTGAGSDSNVYYRLWDSATNNWNTAEQTAQPVSATPTFIAVQFARTRNEAIMGVLDGNNNFYLQLWNGRTWTMLNGGTPLATTSANTSRNFQIAYEYANDRALIVYQDNSRDPQYAIWNGSSLTLAGMILSPSTTYPTASGGTRHLWFRLAPRNVVGSNDILLMSTDSGQDIYALRWTGAAWSNMGNNSRWDTTTSNANNHESIDVAWQSNGTLAVFADGDATTRQIGYRIWNATTSTLSPTGNGSANSTIRLTFPGTCGSSVYEWLRLYPDPNNNILAVMQTANRCLISTVWSAGAFGATALEHEGTNSLENIGARNFDFAWETLPGSFGHGWLLWGSQTAIGGNYLQTRYFTSPSTWGAASAVRDRTLNVQAAALTPSGRFVAAAYQAAASVNDDTESMTTPGGGIAWPNAATTLWTGATTLQQYERVYIARRNSGYINSGASNTGIVKVLQMQENY